ncbi:helix-turn-helix domain-containing protein [Streptomyces sp. NPDC001941]|uniref:TetR/AcrR family transcriptional regulator n=1 Tax=Streptomyces sp. NPDC001941 TaxID=3154659 RepID=UPI0033334A4B
MSDQRPLRADARRNHEHILATARAAFAELGPDVSLNVIAQRAGVGAGTLYRRFPSREVLIEAVYRDDLSRLTDQAVELADRLPAQEALERWIRDVLVPAQHQPGLAATLHTALTTAPEVFLESKRRFSEAADRLVTAAQANGTLRQDIETGDVLRLAAGIAMASADTPDACHRMLTVMFDGLRTT